MNNSSSVRQQFIDFFKERVHQHVVAAPIVNKGDPSLLFTNAGMNQFKEIFLGQQKPTYTRVVNSQPCLRVSGKHNDLEEVGVDTYHHTMFEMLGNWSFGDYFKEEAIKWAWELLTDVYHIPKDKIYVTVFGGDEGDKLEADYESFAIWKKHISHDRILYGSKKDNFWEMGDIGPCGPCTEIHVDIRPEEEIAKQPGKDLVNTGHPQVIEIWNLVFIQYERTTGGNLHPLKDKHVDTGMGFERLMMVLQHKSSTYDTDIFLPLTHNLMYMCKQQYGKDAQADIAMRVIADHVRAITFAIADGQLPSNTQAGYVIRRILRRAVRYGYTSLGFQQPFMYQLVAILSQQFKYVYPHIKQQQSYIEQVIKSEEEIFFRTLKTGLQRVDHLSANLQQQGLQVIDGATVFELYDTYGFPPDLTQLIAQEKGIEIDEAGFQQALQAQRARSQQAARVEQEEWKTVVDSTPTFVGYDQLEVATYITQYRSAHQKGQEVYHIVLDKTPFYPEGGGQLGDTGHLLVDNEVIAVFDTQKEFERIIHYTHQLPQDLTATVKAVVNASRRESIANNHTATHLLHAALRQVLGAHVAQKGSAVTDQSLRFDFSHYSKVTPAQLQTIELIVNQKIRANIALKESRNMPLEQAKALGVTALFGEKYGEHVRVITFDPKFSQELCGGTHAGNTGKLGFFKIIAESGVAAGTRRIEAVTAEAAENFVAMQLATLHQVSEALKKPKEVVKAIEQLLAEKAAGEKKLQAYQVQEIKATIQSLRQRIKVIQGTHILIDTVNLPTAEALKQVAFSFQESQNSAFVILTAVIDQQPHIAIFISKDLVKRTSLNANTLIKELAPLIQGGGGGQPFLATAKGSDPSKLQEVLATAQRIVERHIIQPTLD